jgi:hypothetical protein
MQTSRHAFAVKRSWGSTWSCWMPTSPDASAAGLVTPGSSTRHDAGVLAQCMTDLDRVLDELGGDEERYYRRLQEMTALVLGLGEASDN